jgi:excisionase family DNA binding protein
VRAAVPSCVAGSTVQQPAAMAADEDARRRALALDRLTGITKASRDLGIGPRTLRKAIAAGEIPSYRIGARMRLRLVDIRGWLEAHRRRP